MEYEDFLGILMPYKKLSDDFSELFSMGFDLLEGKYKLEENVARIFDASLPLLLEKGFDMGETCTYVEKKV
jgi:hypothetical protein